MENKLNISPLERRIGSFVGVHTGDSRGAPYETWGPKRITADMSARGNIELFDYPNPWAKTDQNGATLPAGRPTDDTEQTACLAESLIACNGLDTGHLYELLRASVFDEKSLLWSGRSTGAGGTTKNALSGDPVRIEAARNNNIGTNGSLMRCAPMAHWWANELMEAADDRRLIWIAEAKRATFLMSDVTHTHHHANQACWIYTMILASLLGGNTPTRAIEDVLWIDASVLSYEMWIRVSSRLRDRQDYPYDPGDWPGRGTAEFSLYVALYSLLNTTSFREGIDMAVRVGGDTDTYAAIAGGLLGACYGYEAIPVEWRSVILGHDKMVGYATAIYELRCVQ
jgi:ADP-ribosyl-[dinitrogen reductase] hydrolase